MSTHKHDVNETESDFVHALERLQAHNPTHPALIKKKRRGSLKINISTVALEAGHSRTLISHENCAFPIVRTAILNLRKAPRGLGTMAEANRKLRLENAHLRKDYQIAISRMAAMVRRMDRVEKEAIRRTSEIERFKRHNNIDSNEIAGSRLSVRDFPKEENVIEFTRTADAKTVKTTVGMARRPASKEPDK